MASLLLRRNDSADGFRKEGDIVFAANNRSIRALHAERICHRKNFPRVNRRLERDTLAEKFYAHTSEFRFERQGTNVVRTTLATNDQVTFGLEPIELDGRMQSIDVVRFLERHLAHPKNFIFGTEGNEVWYGGMFNRSDAALDAAWSDIELLTELRESDHTEWPFTELEKTHHIIVPSQDFDDETRAAYTRVTMDTTDPTNPTVSKYRSFSVPWRTLVTQGVRRDIEQNRRTGDLRSVIQPIGSDIIQTR